MVTQWAPGSCCKQVSACPSRALAATLTAKASDRDGAEAACRSCTTGMDAPLSTLGERLSPDNSIRIRSIRLGSGHEESGLYCQPCGQQAILCGCMMRSGQKIKGENSRSTGRASCGSASLSATRQPGQFGSRVALNPAGWPQGSAGQAGSGC